MGKGAIRTLVTAALIPVVISSAVAVVGLVQRASSVHPRAAQATPAPGSPSPCVVSESSVSRETPQPVIAAPQAAPLAGVDLVWVRESTVASRFVALDWTGM